MLVSKVKKPGDKGFATRYDKPMTPYQRVLDDPDAPEGVKAALRRRKAKINGIMLYHRLTKRLRRIRAKQESCRNGRNAPEGISLNALRGDSALRAVPSGTSPAPGIEVGGIDLRPKPQSHKERLRQSVQYLTNAKSKLQSYGVRTT